MYQHNLPCSIVYAHCLLPGRAFASLYVLLFLEKESEIGGRVFITSKTGYQITKHKKTAQQERQDLSSFQTGGLKAARNRHHSIEKAKRGTYISARVLLNLLNELGKIDKMRGLPSILFFFRN